MLNELDEKEDISTNNISLYSFRFSFFIFFPIFANLQGIKQQNEFCLVLPLSYFILARP